MQPTIHEVITQIAIQIISLLEFWILFSFLSESLAGVIPVFVGKENLYLAASRNATSLVVRIHAAVFLQTLGVLFSKRVLIWSALFSSTKQTFCQVS